jgi:hypothetical protein
VGGSLGNRRGHRGGAGVNPYGDPMPVAMADYYAQLDANRPIEAAAAFSADAVYGRPAPDAPEVAPRLVIEGRRAIEELLVARGSKPWRHRVLMCAVEGTDCLLEGVTEALSGEVRSTFAATAQLDGAGRVSRYVAFTCEPVTEPGLAGGEASPGDARAVVDRYFEGLRAGDFETAARCFSKDVVYCHPPYTRGGMKGSGRIWFRGRAELHAAFEKRGRTSYRHQVTVLIQRGPNSLFEVRTPGDGGEDLGFGVSSLSLDEQGLMRRYVAFFTTRTVPRR